jgi:hypothetical protein
MLLGAGAGQTGPTGLCTRGLMASVWSIARMLGLPPGKTAAATTCPPRAGCDRSFSMTTGRCCGDFRLYCRQPGLETMGTLRSAERGGDDADGSN